MVPPEGIDKIQPTTLPADFGEWDSGENQETQPEEVKAFDRYPAAPPAPLKPAPAPKAPPARVAVLPPVERPPAAPPREPARRYPEPEPVYERPPVQSLDDDDYEEDESKGKQKKIMIAAAVVVLLVAGGAVGYVKLNSKSTAPSQHLTQQTVATTAPADTAETTTIVLPPKPGAATTATTTAATQAATPADTATQEPAAATGKQADIMNRQLNAPSRISNDLKALGGQAPTAGFSPGAMDMGSGSNVFTPGSGPKVTVQSQRKVSISAGIAVGLLVQKTAPVYPSIAKSARISGTVVIQATISKNGTVENPRVVSGPTMLRQAALDAVKSWRYRPYLLDGTPVEVDTTVNVVFNLGG